MATEKRLIDADVVRRKINAFAASVVYRCSVEMFTGKDTCNPHEYTRGYQQCVLDATNIITGQDPVDAVEVMHGRWEFLYIDGRWFDKCSICGNTTPNRDGSPPGWNYCPNCGADMR